AWALRGRVAGGRWGGGRGAGGRAVRPRAPPVGEAEGRGVLGLRRLAKRIVFELEGGLRLALHLMISGRLHWRERGVAIPKRVGLAAFDFTPGSLLLTEASTKQRAALHLFADEAGLASLDAGGVEPLAMSRAELAAVLAREDHTLKRALTDPRLFAGIGNAYSDEILHRARLSPFKRSRQLDDAEIARLHEAIVSVLTEWRDHLAAENGDAFPEKVTAFRPGMAVHGRYRQPCPV